MPTAAITCPTCHTPLQLSIDLDAQLPQLLVQRRSAALTPRPGTLRPGESLTPKPAPVAARTTKPADPPTPLYRSRPGSPSPPTRRGT